MKKEIYILTFVILALSGFTLTFIKIMNTVLTKPKQSLRLQLKPVQEPKKEPWFVDSWEDGEITIVDGDTWHTLKCPIEAMEEFVYQNGTYNIDYIKTVYSSTDGVYSDYSNNIELSDTFWSDKLKWCKRYAETNIKYWIELPE